MTVFQLIDKKIRDAFSDAAIQYDVLTSLHKEIGRELIRKVIPVEQNETILDVGMGTGWMTSRLQFYFPESTVFGLDFADGMVDYARRKYEDLALVQADAQHMPFCEETFDIIVSNLAFQWMKDIGRSTEECRRCLRPEGKIFLTMFGEKTFTELFESLESVSKDKNGRRGGFRRLAGRELVEQKFEQAGFRDIRADHELIKVHFPDMMALLKWIKSIGANALSRDIFIGKELLAKASDVYNARYRERLGIVATFEVVWIEAVK